MTPYYKNDRVTLYHGDCREIVPALGKFDLLLTDPPYGIGVHKMQLGNGLHKIYRGECEWDNAPVQRWVLDMCRDSATKSIIWGGNYFCGLPPSRGWLVWDKGTGNNSFADAELAWTNLDIVVKKFFHSWVGANARDKNQKRTHPTQKPIELIKWCILLAGDDIKTIFDPFSGSGTTGVAAMKMGRSAVLIEREERYCEIAARRLEREAEQPNLFDAEGENG